MKFTATQTALEAALSVVLKGMSQNTTLPILSGVYLKADAGTLELQCSNLNVAIRHKIPVNVEEPGAAVVSGKVIANIVRALPDEAINFAEEDRLVNIECGNTKYRLNTLNVLDWPEFPEVTVDNSVELPEKVLDVMVSKIHRITSKDTTRPLYQGINLTIQNNIVRLEATDTLRFAFCDTSCATNETKPFSAVIPGAAFYDAISLAAQEDRVVIEEAANQIVFSFGNTTFVTRKIEGSFPNVDQLLPKSVSTAVRIKVGSLSAALKRASVMALSDTVVFVDINSEESVLRLSSSSVEQGESREVVFADVEGNNLSVAYNYRFIFDILNAAKEDDELVIELESETQPGVFKINGDINYLCLMMPVYRRPHGA